MKNKSKVIGIVIVIFIGLGMILLTKAMMPKPKIKENTCNEERYEIISYSSNYNQIENEKYYLLKSKKDYEEKVKMYLPSKKIDDFDFNKYDYLVYFVDTQIGCDRSIRLNCVEFKNKKVILKLKKYDVDQSCETSFFDAYLVKLDKDKYNEVVVNEE